MRNMAALIGSGVMDRYPGLRIGTLEAGHGWLPFWMARIDEHAETVKAALPESRAQASKYVLSGRYFQSIEIPEGERLTNSVIDLLARILLMYASDYPHGESWFPSRRLRCSAGTCRRSASASCSGQRRAVLRALRLGVKRPRFYDPPERTRSRRTEVDQDAKKTASG